MLRLRPTTLQLTQQDVTDLHEVLDASIAKKQEDQRKLQHEMDYQQLMQAQIRANSQQTSGNPKVDIKQGRHRGSVSKSNDHLLFSHGQTSSQSNRHTDSFHQGMSNDQ